MFCNEFIEKLPYVAAVIITPLSLKSGIKFCKVEGREVDKSLMKNLKFRDTFNPNHYKEITEEQKSFILESQMYHKEI